MDTAKSAHEPSGLPPNTFTIPAPVDVGLTPFWTTLKQRGCFLMQKSQSAGVLKSLLTTIANVLDTKQPPYRILFQRDPSTVSLLIAVAETDAFIEKAWQWLQQNIFPEMDSMDSGYAKEEFVKTKIQMIVTATDAGTDELSTDESVRSASRSFRQLFDVPSSERLVSYYSCAFNSRQGWFYISENYIGFHSFLLGVETKLLLELKDVQDIQKEKSKRSVFPDTIRITTKDSKEYIFSTMFKRDEVYDLLVHLAGQAMLRLLKHSSGDTPGAAIYSASEAESSAFGPFVSSPHAATDHNTAASTAPPSERHLIKPLKQDLATQKRNHDFCHRFRLPMTEQLSDSLEIAYTLKSRSNSSNTPTPEDIHGRVYLSENFLVYESQQRLPKPQQHQPILWLTLPLYTVRRVERINAGSYNAGLSITTCHQIEHIFRFQGLKPTMEAFCQRLRSYLRLQTLAYKHLKVYLEPFISEKMFDAIPDQSVGRLIDVDDSSSNLIQVGGLGQRFGYPGNPKQTKDRSKMRLWNQYFTENGRNLAMLHTPTFGKLVRVGLPNELRGEIWEMCSGSAYLRFSSSGVYDDLIKMYSGQSSLATEEIEKDLTRSLPEYPGYQTGEGIDRLRRVLTAYSWRNPELGYCQAMNIVTSAMLIYATEEQAFWLLNVLVDELCPGYYSTSMYGALLDQIIFEQLVEKTMPILWDHFKSTDVQLSVACLPWFLSLYVNSMPLLFAFRVLDCLFMEGPRILFQIGLAILKMNGDALLKSKDDGAFLDILKHFFTTLGDPIGSSKQPGQASRLTKFNELMLIAYREFSLVTDDMIKEMRRTNQLKVAASIESYTKRSAIRHLDDMAGFTKDEVAIIYDKFFGALYYAKTQGDRQDHQLDFHSFLLFLEGVTTWGKTVRAQYSPKSKIQLHDFANRLYLHFKLPQHLGISFQDAVTGLSEILHGDLMSIIELFFKLYSNDGNKLNMQELTDLAKDVSWFVVQLHQDDAALGWDAIRALVLGGLEQSAVEHGDDPPDTESLVTKMVGVQGSLAQRFSALDQILQQYSAACSLSLPSFRMVVLTNETLEMLFDHEFQDSFHLENSNSVERQKSLGRELFENLFREGKNLAQAPSPRMTSSSTTTASPLSKALPVQSTPNSTSIGQIAQTATVEDNDNIESEVDQLFKQLGHLDVEGSTDNPFTFD
ncbi:TBC-domain-containing protein [Hesseltinella vesiculosa]|uniref:TBC-domain-containing protein n=1 Tax=Hesseltinella vesiculosa TaxID=101127 RepID=A0A1X2G5F3_9FUNG|nr:TBC-domain-containing protein [Hesseltinella vesiculosa]